MPRRRRRKEPARLGGAVRRARTGRSGRSGASGWQARPFQPGCPRSGSGPGPLARPLVPVCLELRCDLESSMRASAKTFTAIRRTSTPPYAAAFPTSSRNRPRGVFPCFTFSRPGHGDAAPAGERGRAPANAGWRADQRCAGCMPTAGWVPSARLPTVRPVRRAGPGGWTSLIAAAAAGRPCTPRMGADLRPWPSAHPFAGWMDDRDRQAIGSSGAPNPSTSLGRPLGAGAAGAAP